MLLLQPEALEEDVVKLKGQLATFEAAQEEQMALDKAEKEEQEASKLLHGGDGLAKQLKSAEAHAAKLAEVLLTTRVWKTRACCCC